MFLVFDIVLLRDLPEWYYSFRASLQKGIYYFFKVRRIEFSEPSNHTNFSIKS